MPNLKFYLKNYGGHGRILKKLDKNLILIVTIITVLTVTLLLGYNSDRKRQLEVTKLDGDILTWESQGEILYSIDSIDIYNGVGNIKGWAVIKGVNSFNLMPTIILKSEQGDLYKIKTRIFKRRDITKVFNGETADDNTHLTVITRSKAGVTRNKNVYDNSGITSEFKISELRKNENYKIGIKLQSDKRSYFIWTDKELAL